MNIKNVRKFLNDNDKYLIVTHYGADGDAIGSMLGLKFLLELKGKEAITWHPEKPNSNLGNFSSLNKDAVITKTNFKFNFNDYNIIAVDCGSQDRVCPFKLRENYSNKHKIFTLQIDHHPTNTSFAKYNYVDSQASSTCEMIWNIFRDEFLNKNNDYDVINKIANCLYVGVFTDTGSFSYNNASYKSYLMASELIKWGVDPSQWRKEIFGQVPLNVLKMEAKMIDNVISFHDNKVLIGIIDKELLESCNLTLEQGMDKADKLRDIKGVDIAITIRCFKEGLYKVSSRTDNENIDLSQLASKYKGGGHKMAAGWMWDKDPQELVKLLEIETKELLDNQNS